jgi:hypothetical protein
VEGTDTTECCLVPQEDRLQHWLLTTPVPCSPWHDASHLGLGGLVLLRMNPHEPPGPKMHVQGEGGYSRWQLGARL